MKMRFPGFKILDRYILGKFLSTYFFAIAMIIVIVVASTTWRRSTTSRSCTHPEIGHPRLLPQLIPYFINQFSGLFTFIACIFFTSKMAYQTEIVAMLSGGMSFRRLMWPYFLGALIIALSMLVDNAIVIVEGVLIARQQGSPLLGAINYVIRRSALPLLGATVIAILAFGQLAFPRTPPGSIANPCSRCC